MQRADQAVDRVGREEVAMAIAQAEADIERALGYRLLPSWEYDEWHATVRPYYPELVNLTGNDVRGYAAAIETDWKQFISGGVRASTVIASELGVTYSDRDGDTYKEEALTSSFVLPAGVNDCELHIIDSSHAGDFRFEIRPIEVIHPGGFTQIRFSRNQMVQSINYDDLFPDPNDSQLRGVNGAIDANFYTEVDVYRVYNDPQTQATFHWEQGACGCGSAGCSQCQFASQMGCLMPRGDPRLGIVAYQPGNWNATNNNFDAAAWAVCQAPDVVRLFYYAGLRRQGPETKGDSIAPAYCPKLRMESEWERVVAYYAAALLDRPVCECNNVHAWIEHWRRDLAVPGVDEGLRVSAEDLNNPFGTRRGAVFAWKRVKARGVGESLVAV